MNEKEAEMAGMLETARVAISDALAYCENGAIPAGMRLAMVVSLLNGLARVLSGGGGGTSVSASVGRQ